VAIYKMQIRGSDKVRLVKAATAAQARDHIVEAVPINAETMADLMEKDPALKLEKVADPTDPASYAPGGALHQSGGSAAGENGKED